MASTKDKGSFSYGKYFKEIDTLHGLQSKPEERSWLLSVPKGEVKPTRIVLYLGCNVMRTTHLVRTVVDIFKLLGVDFVAVGGASYCCGIQHFQNGDEDASRSIASTTVQQFQMFQVDPIIRTAVRLK